MSAISLKTPIPGPRSIALAVRRARAVSSSVSQITPIYAARAHGAVLEDVDGNCFLDFAGGIGCVNAGHASPEVVEAIQHQAANFLHTCFMVAGYEGYIELAERLNALAPGPTPKRTFLCNSGAEAVENSVKIARAATGRTAILAFSDAFHGRTYMAMALTAKQNPYKTGFAPFPGEVYRIPYPYSYRCDRGLSTCNPNACACSDTVEAMEQAYFQDIHPSEVAAIIVEPVLGEGGFVVPPANFLPNLRSLCDRYGILLIADEIQTGFGRTGAMFACDHTATEPDLLLSAKSLASGMPLAAIIGKATLMDTPVAGALGGTYGGNPIACAAALATLDILERDHLSLRAQRIGEIFHQRALAWQDTYACIGEVRGLGAMQAIEFVEDPLTKAPAAALAKQITQHCYRNGLILITAGTYGNVVRLLVPLVVSDDELNEGLDILDGALQALAPTQILVPAHATGGTSSKSPQPSPEVQA